MAQLRSRSCRLRGNGSLAPEAVAIAQEPFAIVNTGNLRLFDELSLLGNERAAVPRMNELLEANPSLRRRL